MEMTFRQYIDNPLGKRNAVFSQRDMYKNLYTDKFDKLLLREAGKIDFALYYDDKDQYYVHIKIPSEGVKNFYYDAVIMFYTNDAAVHSQSSLDNYFVKFFSNDPAFVFTYLRVFLKNGMFFEDLKDKSSKLALKEDPIQTNPYQIPGYSKIIYFAYLFMKYKNLFSKYYYKSYGKKYNKKEFIKTIMHTDDKIALRQELGEKQRKQEKKEAEKEKKDNEKLSTSTTSSSNFPLTAKRVSYTKSSPNIKTTKTTKFTAKTKTTKK